MEFMNCGKVALTFDDIVTVFTETAKLKDFETDAFIGLLCITIEQHCKTHDISKQDVASLITQLFEVDQFMADKFNDANALEQIRGKSREEIDDILDEIFGGRTDD